jgi:FkbM family methyltransferase
MLVTPSEHIQQQLFWYGYYEKPVTVLLQMLLKPDSIMLDIGANVGYFTVIAASLAKNGKVYAFEPVTELFEKLKTNIHENNLFNAMAINAAAGESQRESLIYISDESNKGMSSLKPPENFSGYSQPVTIVRIDDWIKQTDIDRVDFIKIDVEGYELFALQGMTEMLMNFTPVLIVEINANTLAYFCLSPNDVMEFLKNLGYMPFNVNENGLLKKIGTARWAENLAFIHSGKLTEFDAYVVE